MVRWRTELVSMRSITFGFSMSSGSASLRRSRLAGRYPSKRKSPYRHKRPGDAHRTLTYRRYKASSFRLSDGADQRARVVTLRRCLFHETTAFAEELHGSLGRRCEPWLRTKWVPGKCDHHNRAAFPLYDYVYERPARKHFRWWHGWAVRSRLQPMIEVARMLKRRFENIITYLRHRITNASSESINAKIQWVKYTARGFRNKRNFVHAIYFHCGGLDLAPAATK